MAGNTTTRDPADAGAQALTWDVEGELVAVDGVGDADASYVYTADGDRLVRREGGVTTVYLPGGQEITRNNTTGAVTGTRYYAFGGQVIAVRTQPGYAGVDSLVSDPQGTAQVAVDNATNQVTRRYFDPYGSPVGGTGADWAGDHGFLDKPVDDTGLVAIGARYYDPGIARFISVDPIMDLSDPGQWQGYAYANNNPVTYTDPTGLKAKKKAGGVSRGTGGGAPTAGKIVTSIAKTVDPPVDDPNSAEAFGQLAAEHRIQEYVDRARDFSWPEARDQGMDLATWLGINGNIEIYQRELDNCSEYQCPDPCSDQACQARRAFTILGEYVLGEVIGLGVAALMGRLASRAAARTGATEAAAGAEEACAGGACGIQGQMCFVAGTGVLLADGTVVAIENVKVGDRVVTTDPATGEESAHAVTRLYRHENAPLYDVVIDGATVAATPTHPFWVVGRGWVTVDQLRPGDALLQPDDTTVTVEVVRATGRTATVYNFEVQDAHDYYVRAGNHWVLVHNDCGPSLDAIRIARHANEEGHVIPGVAEHELDIYVDGVMQTPAAPKVGGGEIWWDPSKGSVVIRNPDGYGTTFVPDTGIDYYFRWRED